MIPGLPQVGGAELIILLVIILLFFGANRIPSLARSLGEGIREFRKGTPGQHEEVEQKGKRLPEKGKAGSETASEAKDDALTKQKS